MSKYNKLAGKKVLVIGGSSGIGFCVAEAAIESSAEVTISSSSTARVDKAVEKLKASYPKASVQGFACDLSKTDSEKDIEALFEKTGKVDHVVYTAGDKLSTVPIKDVTYETIEKAGRVRFFSALLTAKIASRYLNSGPASSITFTTGAVGEKPIPEWSVVASYAAGLHGMIRNLALDLKPIRVNLVSPGPVETELWDGIPEEARKKMMSELASKTLTGSVGKPEDVAETYLWLMKDYNVTGEVAHSNSGQVLV